MEIIFNFFHFFLNGFIVGQVVWALASSYTAANDPRGTYRWGSTVIQGTIIL